MVGKMGSDTMTSSSREDLEAAKEHFVQTVDFPNISCKIGVRTLEALFIQHGPKEFKQKQTIFQAIDELLSNW